MFELKKRNIDVLAIFDLEEHEIQEFIEKHTKNILEMFIANIPNFTESAIGDSYEFSKIGYFQNSLKSEMKTKWKQLNLPSDFNLMGKEDLEMVKKYTLGWKRWFLGDKKKRLRLNQLADEADNLRKEYRDVKKKYREHKKSFFLLKKTAPEKEWQDYWINFCAENFSELNSEAIAPLAVEEFPPFELVHIHLADVYDYDKETMKKKIAASRKLKRG